MSAKKITEGAMSDLSIEIGSLLDDHIDAYKEMGGAEALMNKAGHAAIAIGRTYNLEPSDATKLVSDYIESALQEDGISEGIGKVIKRAFQGWDKSHTGTPKELVKRNRAYDDETIKSLAKGRDISKPTHSPRGLQDKVLGQELKRRGIGEESKDGRTAASKRIATKLQNMVTARNAKIPTPAERREMFKDTDDEEKLKKQRTDLGLEESAGDANDAEWYLQTDTSWVNYNGKELLVNVRAVDKNNIEMSYKGKTKIVPLEQFKEMVLDTAPVTEGEYDDDYNPDSEELSHGDYVRDEQNDGPNGEVFKMSGDPYDRRVRIEDKDGRGWAISPDRLTKVTDERAIAQYFGGNDDDDEDLDESTLTPPAVKVKVVKNGNEYALHVRRPGQKVTGWSRTFDSKEDAEKFVHQKWGVDALTESIITEKSKSPKQARMMAAAAHDPKFAKKVGVKSSVAKEFNKADTGTKQLSNATKGKKKIKESTMDTNPIVNAELKKVLKRFPHEVAKFESEGELDNHLYDALFDHYLDNGEMPYGVSKARDGDPYNWISDQLASDLNPPARGMDLMKQQAPAMPQATPQESFESEEMIDEGLGDTLEDIIARNSAAVEQFRVTGDMDDSLYTDLFDYYYNNGEMPYGTAKARTGDPIEWVANAFEDDLGITELANKYPSGDAEMMDEAKGGDDEATIDAVLADADFTNGLEYILDQGLVIMGRSNVKAIMDVLRADSRISGTPKIGEIDGDDVRVVFGPVNRPQVDPRALQRDVEWAKQEEPEFESAEPTGSALNEESFNAGDRVKKHMGVRLSGKVIPQFYWKDSTDGTYSEPEKGYVSVQWDDGTKGYVHKSHIVKEDINVNITASGEDDALNIIRKLSGMAPVSGTIGMANIPALGGPDMSEPEDEIEIEEEYANEPDEHITDTNTLMRQGDDMHRRKTQYADKPKLGDNPMATESKDPLKFDSALMKMYNSIKKAK